MTCKLHTALLYLRTKSSGTFSENAAQCSARGKNQKDDISLLFWLILFSSLWVQLVGPELKIMVWSLKTTFCNVYKSTVSCRLWSWSVTAKPSRRKERLFAIQGVICCLLPDGCLLLHSPWLAGLPTPVFGTSTNVCSCNKKLLLLHRPRTATNSLSDKVQICWKKSHVSHVQHRHSRPWQLS